MLGKIRRKRAYGNNVMIHIEEDRQAGTYVEDLRRVKPPRKDNKSDDNRAKQRQETKHQQEIETSAKKTIALYQELLLQPQFCYIYFGAISKSSQAIAPFFDPLSLNYMISVRYRCLYFKYDLPCVWDIALVVLFRA
jgi:hypothetical protein